MQYLLDTNAIIRHFARLPNLGRKAKPNIEQGENNEHRLFISVISLMEIMYLAEKNRIPIDFAETIQQLNFKTCYTIVDLNVDILSEATTVKFYELHDRLIIATAKHIGIPIISSDKKFKQVEEIEVIW